MYQSGNLESDIQVLQIGMQINVNKYERRVDSHSCDDIVPAWQDASPGPYQILSQVKGTQSKRYLYTDLVGKKKEPLLYIHRWATEERGKRIPSAPGKRGNRPAVALADATTA